MSQPTFRPYQTTLSDDIDLAWAAGARNVLAKLPCGGGKTVIMAHKARTYRGASICIAHRHHLVAQMSLALARNGVRHRLIGATDLARLIVTQHVEKLGRSFYDPQAWVGVASVDTLARRAPDDAWFKQITLWQTDECFPAGTLVDGRPIETLRVGDVVASFDERFGVLRSRRIVRLFKNPAPRHMVRLYTQAHHVLECTPNHPIFTQRGWVAAGGLNADDKVLYVPEARGPKRLSTGAIREDRAGVLQSRVFDGLPSEAVIRNGNQNQPQVCVGAHETKQPDAPQKIAGQDAQNAVADWAPTERPGRQRDAATPSGSGAFCDLRGHGLRDAICDSDGETQRRREENPAQLQSGLGQSDAAAGDRSGRGLSRNAGAQGTGPEERGGLRWIGLDRIEVYEPGNSQRPDGGCGEGFVYNLEIEDFHTYVAGGIVVHNCHHLLRKNKWGKAVALFPNAHGIGWTATPGRADGYGLGRHADGVFDAMVSGPGMRELITAGYLTDYKLLCPPSDLKLDESDLGESGEFKQAAVSAAVRGSHITGDVVSHYLRYAAGKLGMVFAVDVDHATQLLAGFQAAGVPAEVITHLTHPTARAAVMRRYERREVLVVINVDLFGEGTDFPALEVVSLARPTASYPLYEQQFCRALRLLEGKAYGLILDHAGNTMRHGGPPDCPRHYSLDRRERRGPHLPADGVPMRACTACTAPYARTRLTCPYCGAEAPEPAGRASPEQVEGDLVLLDGAALAALRGEVAHIDGPARVPGHLDGPARISCERRHLERQQAQATLRATIALWGGWRRREGEDDREAQRRFWFRFGVDVATAQTLGAREAGELCSRVAGDLSTAGVVAAT